LRTGAAGVAVAVAVAVTLVLGGCTGGGTSHRVATAGGPASATGGDRPATDPAERERQLIACMRGQGVEVMDPVPGEPPGNAMRHELDDRGQGLNPAFQAALDHCAAFLTPAPSKAPADAQDIARRRQFSVCMRSNGLPDFPDPDPDGSIAYAGPSDAPYRVIQQARDGVYLGAGPQIQAAVQKCEQLLPQPSASAGAP
jgi:hypothetical protein